jgi:putative PIN family toxin of toxin-antitoxin system
LKVVIDTNIFVSSFLGGRPRQVIDLWKQGEIVLCLSKDILDEYVDVLQRLGFADEQELAELLALIKKGIHLVFTAKTPRMAIVKNDPSDDKFLECAVKLRAEYVITGDKALKAVGQYQGIKSLTPQEFLKIFPPAFPESFT